MVMRLLRHLLIPDWFARRAFPAPSLRRIGDAISQSETDERKFGRMRYSLWTGDPGLAIYLWDCIHERADFPTLDTFFVPIPEGRSPAPRSPRPAP